MSMGSSYPIIPFNSRVNISSLSTSRANSSFPLTYCSKASSSQPFTYCSRDSSSQPLTYCSRASSRQPSYCSKATSSLHPTKYTSPSSSLSLTSYTSPSSSLYLTSCSTSRVHPVTHQAHFGCLNLTVFRLYHPGAQYSGVLELPARCLWTVIL
jgi:hypothetical protein